MSAVVAGCGRFQGTRRWRWRARAPPRSRQPLVACRCRHRLCATSRRSRHRRRRLRPPLRCHNEPRMMAGVPTSWLIAARFAAPREPSLRPPCWAAWCLSRSTGNDPDAGKAGVWSSKTTPSGSTRCTKCSMLLPLFSWHAGSKHRFVRIETVEITGRRLHVIGHDARGGDRSDIHRAAPLAGGHRHDPSIRARIRILRFKRRQRTTVSPRKTSRQQSRRDSCYAKHAIRGSDGKLGAA